VQHADFDGICADVAQDGAYLSADEVRWHGVNAEDANGVLIDDGGDSRGAVAAAGGEGLQVSLYAGAAARVAACYGQCAAVAARRTRRRILFCFVFYCFCLFHFVSFCFYLFYFVL
jgi:hypothetical protein